MKNRKVKIVALLLLFPIWVIDALGQSYDTHSIEIVYAPIHGDSLEDTSSLEYVARDDWGLYRVGMSRDFRYITVEYLTPTGEYARPGVSSLVFTFKCGLINKQPLGLLDFEEIKATGRQFWGEFMPYLSETSLKVLKTLRVAMLETRKHFFPYTQQFCGGDIRIRLKGGEPLLDRITSIVPDSEREAYHREVVREAVILFHLAMKPPYQLERQDLEPILDRELNTIVTSEYGPIIYEHELDPNRKFKLRESLITYWNIVMVPDISEMMSE